MEDPFGNDVIRQGERFELDLSNFIRKLIERNILFFDTDRILKEKENFAKELSEILGYEEKRIIEDKTFRFERDLKKGLERIKNYLIRSGYLKEDMELSEKSFKIYAGKIIGEIEKEIEGIYEYGRFRSNYYGNEEEFFLKKFGLGDNYFEINIKESIRKSLISGDLRLISEKKREKKGGKYIILLDVSGSMFGEKINEAKKACIVLLEKILKDNNDAILILYNDKIIYESEVKSIESILSNIIKIIPNGSTDIALALKRALDYTERNSNIIIITDALPTYGEKPLENTLETVKKIRELGSYVSVIGIELNNEGREIAKRIIELGNGNLFIIKDVKDLSKILLINYELLNRS